MSLFADHGAQVVLLSRDSSRLEAARSRIGHIDQTLALACDVRHREEIDRVIGLIMHHFRPDRCLDQQRRSWITRFSRTNANVGLPRNV